MSLSKRKDEHIEKASEFYNPYAYSDFDSIKFVHHSLPELATDDIKLNTSILSLNLDYPFYINAMTGGSKKAKKVNEKLAIIARETNLLMAAGSSSIAFKEDKLASFQVIRKMNPNGLVLANIGADNPVEIAKKAIDLLAADGLQIHLNAPQELVMPEGDKNFYWLKNIEDIINHVSVPVIVKEVGFGMSRETIEQLKDIGVKAIDISGRGGSNFVRIENARRLDYKYSYLDDWGQSTVISLLEGQEYLPDICLLASGGIRNPLDIVKSLALGAKAVGLSGYFLNKVLTEEPDEIITQVKQMIEQIKNMMIILGKSQVSDLVKTDIIINGVVKDWCQARKINFQNFANRSS